MENSQLPRTAAAGRTLAAVLFRTVAAVRSARPATAAEAMSAGCLQLLSLYGAQRVTLLAERLGLSQPGTTQLVDRLEARGEVRRVADPADGRAVLVQITARGQQRLDADLSDVGAVLTGLLERLDETDRSRVVEAMAVLDVGGATGAALATSGGRQ